MNKEVISVLEKINNITESVILSYPHTFAASEANDIKIMVDLSKFDNQSFPDIGLLNSFGNFLSLFKLFDDDRTVKYEGDTIIIESGDIKTNFISSSMVIMDSFKMDDDQFIKVKSAPSILDMNLTVDDINKISKASGIFKELDEVIIKSVDGDVELSLGAIGKFNAGNNSFSIRKSEKASKDFIIRVPIQNFKMLPLSEYKLSVKYNAAKDSYRLFLENKTIEGFQVILTTKI